MAGNMLTYPIYYMDNIVPSAASLISPANKTIVRDSQFTFAWYNATDNYSVGMYQYQYAKDTSFSLGLFDTTICDTSLYRKLPTTDTLYYWRVRPIDAAGNIGSWSSLERGNGPGSAYHAGVGRSLRQGLVQRHLGGLLLDHSGQVGQGGGGEVCQTIGHGKHIFQSVPECRYY